MWISRRKRGHIDLETLSEYLDGRLGASSRQAIELHLETCSRCKEELESQEHTASLLRQVPAVVPRRSFFIEGAVTAPEPPRRIMVPAWGYGAAASMAVVIFAVILSADLGGLLSEEVSPPKLPGQPAAVSVPRTPSPQPTIVPDVEREVALTTEAAPAAEAHEEVVSEIAAEASAEIIVAPAVAEPTPVPQPAADPVETEAIVAADAEDAAPRVEAVREVEEFAASTPSPQAAAAAARAEAPEAAMAVDEAGSPEVVDAEMEIVATQAAISPATPLPSPAPAVGLDEPEPEATLAPTPTAAPTLTPEPSPTPTVFPTPTPKPAPTVSVEEREASAATSMVAEAQESPGLLPVEPTDGGTAVVWRVLEGVLGGLALALISGALWRVWSRRRRGA